MDSQSQPPKVIFSLTSFPARIKFVHHTIFSLLTQSTKADEIALFLSAQEFGYCDQSQNLQSANSQEQFSESSALNSEKILDSENQNLNSQNHAATQKTTHSPYQECLISHHHAQNLLRTLPLILRAMHYCSLLKIYFVRDNLKSYKKLIYALKIYPEALIVTIDDDKLYPKTLLSNLLASYQKFPTCIHTNWAQRLEASSDKTQVIAQDLPDFQAQGVPLLHLRLFSGSGTLYPPHSLGSEIFNTRAFMQLAPHNDDLWISLMSIIAGTPKVLVPNHIDNPADHLASFESPNLYHKNFAPKDGGQNYFEMEFNNLMRAYPQAKSLILESISRQIC